MEIGEFSAKTGISIDTLRYYDKIGLLKPNKNKQWRCYSEVDLEIAQTINTLKGLSFTLREIKTLFKLEENIDIGSKLKDGDREKIKDCSRIIKDKYQDILAKEQDIIRVKMMLEKMAEKTDRLLSCGYFFK